MTQTTSPRKLVQFDIFGYEQRCMVALVGTVALLQKALALHRQTDVRPLDWAAFMNATKMESVKHRTEKRALSSYFEIKDNKVVYHLDLRNQTTQGKLGNVIAKLVRERVTDGSLATDDLKREEGGNADELATLIQRLEMLAVSQLESPLKDSHLTQQIARFKNVPDMDDAVVAFIDEIYGNTNLPHPLFPKLKIFDLRVLKAELLDLCNREGQDGVHGGIFAVVREARGWAEKDQKGANLIVRDILWLLPQHVSDNKPDHPSGLYISAVDNQAFTIDRTVPEEKILHMVGHMENKSDMHRRSDMQRMKFILAKFEAGHRLEYRYGVLTGVSPSDTGPNLASWKVICIKPTWDTRVLDCVIAQTYQSNPVECAQLVFDCGYSGVMYSNNISKLMPGLIRRFITLRSLFADDQDAQNRLSTRIGGFFRTVIEGIVRSLIDETAVASKAGSFNKDNTEERAGRFIEDISNVLEENWKYVNPAQFAINIQPKPTRHESDVDKHIKDNLDTLLSLSDIYTSDFSS